MSAAEWARTSWRHARRAGVIVIGILAAGVVMSLTVDLAGLVPAVTLGRVDLRRSAERALGGRLDRTVHIGGLSLRVFDGRFIVSDLTIGGPTPEDAPFLQAREIVVNVPLWSLVRGELNIVSVEMSDWRMTVETFSGGRHTFPRFKRDQQAGGKSPITVSVAYVRTRRGEFVFQDHGTPWGVVVRNLDVTVLKLVGYRGFSTSSGGTVTVQSYTPMSADLRTWFRIDGGQVLLDRIELDSDGAKSTMTGVVDIARWPEQTYEIDSVIDLATQRGIWWAPYTFTLSGEAVFKGRFHYFKGGRELSGRFRSEEAGLDWLRFPELDGHVRWTPDRVEVTDAGSKLYGGTARFTYTMSMFGRDIPTAVRFDATYADVNLRAFTDAMEMQGLRLAGTMSGHNLLEWRLGHWDEHQGHGTLTAVPPPGVTLQGRAPGPALRSASYAHVFGDPFPPLGAVPIGGTLNYQFGPEWVDVAPSRIATETTFVEFQGRTAYGERSVIPFHVTSSEWQESDRLLAGIITAFGSPTRAVEMGGAGTFDGVLLKAFRAPRIEGTFAASRMRAWDVDWGRGDARIVVENGYVDVTDGEARKGDGALRANGRFSLGFPRKDGGEEINAVVTIDEWILKDLRHAFILDEYPFDGNLSGEFHLYGKYLEPHGFGRVSVAPAIAYGETLTSASAALRFVGPGVWLDAIDIRKGTTGVVRGVAHVEWAGFYSFNVDARQIPVESIDMLAFPSAPLTGALEFEASGSGAFLEPDVRRLLPGARPVRQRRRDWRRRARRARTAQRRRELLVRRRVEPVAGVRCRQGDAARQLPRRCHVRHPGHVDRPVRADVRPRAVPVRHGSGLGHAAHQRHAGQPREHRRPDAGGSPGPDAVRLPPAQRGPDRRLPRAGRDAHRPPEARRRGHAALRGRERRRGPGRPGPEGRRLGEPGHPPGVSERHPGKREGASHRRLHRLDGEAPAERQRGSRWRPAAPHVAAACHRRHQRPRHLHRVQRAVRRRRGDHRPRGRAVRRADRPRRAAAIAARSHLQRRRHGAAVSRRLPLGRRRRSQPARQPRQSDARRHGAREAQRTAAHGGYRRGPGRTGGQRRRRGAGRGAGGPRGLVPASLRRAG